MTLEVNGAFDVLFSILSKESKLSTFKMSSQPDALISAETSEADALSKSFISALKVVRELEELGIYPDKKTEEDRQDNGDQLLCRVRQAAGPVTRRFNFCRDIRSRCSIQIIYFSIE